METIKMETIKNRSTTPILLDDWRLSSWAYNYCLTIEDDPEVARLITNSFFAMLYCTEINDNHNTRQYIIDSPDIRDYNRRVKFTDAVAPLKG